jgi:hypothetical protein
MIVYTDEQFHKEIGVLPPKIQAIVKSMDIAFIINGISAKADLLLNEMGDVYEETKKVILGKTPASQFVNAIKSRLGEERQDKAAAIAEEISAEVLSPILENFEEATSKPTEPLSINRIDRTRAPETGNAPPAVLRPLNLLTATGDEELNRDKLLKAMERPAPAMVQEHRAWRAAKETGQKLPAEAPPPRYLPGAPNQAADYLFGDGGGRKVPIIRTMAGDAAREQNDGNEPPAGEVRSPAALPNRPAPAVLTAVPAAGAANTEPPRAHFQVNRGKFGHGTPPGIRQQPAGLGPEERAGQEAARVTPKTETVKNVVADKLTKTVSLPSKASHYTVDPYREPLD